MQDLTQQRKQCITLTIWDGNCALIPPYSPDLVSSDFHMFNPLKEFTRGTNFESKDEAKSVVSDWMRHQSKDFYAEEIRKLEHKWKKSVKLMGDYVEKKIRLLSEL